MTADRASEDVRVLLDRGARTLSAAGLDAPRREAAALLGALVGASPLALTVGHLPEALALELPGDVAARYAERISARAARVPLQHLLGTTGFHDVELETPPGVLVPRPETERVVDAALRALAGVRTPLVADLGSGSGAIAVALAVARPDARVVAVDRCPTAAACTARNARRARAEARVHVLRGHWLRAFGPSPRFDAIVANPPYVRTHELAGLAPEVRDHDPWTALDGGPDGLDAYRELAAVLPRHLRRGGAVVLEIGADQGEVVPRLLAEAGLVSIQTSLDDAGRDRVVVARTECGPQ